MLTEKPPLLIAPAPRQAAVYATKHWHYSQCMPSGKLVTHGVWEHGEFKGVIIYGRGANRHMAGWLGCEATEVVELVRIALREHDAPVTRMVAISLRMLKKGNPGLRAVVSYADTRQGHEGVIYKAGNWTCCGASVQQEVWDGNAWVHKRTASARYGSLHGMRFRKAPKKHRFVMPLDNEMRARVAALAETPDDG